MLNKITDHHSYIESANTTIIFLHGNSMNAWMFRFQIESDLLKQFQMISLDLPGHGGSPRFDSYKISNLNKALLNEMEDFENVILVGHSLGGHLVIQLLPYLDNRCKGIFLIGTPPLKLPLNVQTAYNITEESAVLLQNNISENQLKSLADLIYSGEDEIKTELIKSMHATDGKFREDFGASLGNGEIDDELEILKKFDGKITVVVGEDDALVNQEYVKDLTAEIKDCQFHLIPNSGHCPHLDNPNILNDLLFDFIDQK